MPTTIFRFDQLQRAEPFVEHGLITFGPAAVYNDSKLSDAQRDNELRRTSVLDPARHQISVTPPGGQPQLLQNLLGIEVSFDIRDNAGEFLRYHILCCSLCKEERFYSEFPVDCCITIHDTPEFHCRLNGALRAQLSDWGGGSRRVIYFPPHTIINPESTFDLVFMKDASYAWQKEFRYALISPPDELRSDRVSLTLGSLKDIATLSVPSPSQTFAR